MPESTSVVQSGSIRLRSISSDRRRDGRASNHDARVPRSLE